jgi:hypothetical protein
MMVGTRPLIQEIFRKNKAANEAAQEAGFDGAHDAKEDRGGSQVNIYKDKEGNYWLWDGNNKSEPDPL